jgi:hypothetical protein
VGTTRSGHGALYCITLHASPQRVKRLHGITAVATAFIDNLLLSNVSVVFHAALPAVFSLLFQGARGIVPLFRGC